MNVWVPSPFYLLVLAWAISFLFTLFTPALYLLTLKFSSKSKNFSTIILSLVVALAALNMLYFNGSWSYGTKYQGMEHTQIVALENIIGFSMALLLSAWSHFKKSRAGTYAASFLLFALLSWCAFPYLGELP